MDSGRMMRRRVQQTRDPRKSRARVVTDQRRRRTRVSGGAFENDHSGPSRRQLTPIAGLRQVRDRMAVRIRERPDTLDQRIGTAAKLTAKSNSEFPERNGHCAVPEA
jgi:hypothetical protein